MALPNYGMLFDIFKISARGVQTIGFGKPDCLRIGSSAYKTTSQQSLSKPSYGFGMTLPCEKSRNPMSEESSRPLAAKLYNNLLSPISTTMASWVRYLEHVLKRWLTNLEYRKTSPCSSVMASCTFVLLDSARSRYREMPLRGMRWKRHSQRNRPRNNP